MAVFPFVFFRHPSLMNDKVLVNHERIHLVQQMELLIIPFYLIYAVNYLYNLISTGDHESAYRNIVFEKEAYSRQDDEGYLKNRKLFSFFYHL